MGDPPGAPKTCQFLGGCRPAGEICTEDWQCRSNLDISEGGGAMCLEENATEGLGCGAHEIDGDKEPTPATQGRRSVHHSVRHNRRCYSSLHN